MSIRLYDTPNAQKVSTGIKPIRLYEEPAPAPTKPVAQASGASGAKGYVQPLTPNLELPVRSATVKPHLQPSYGASSIPDVSGKPLLTFTNTEQKKSQLLNDRTYPGFDPTVPQKVGDTLYNPRMKTAVSQQLRETLGATAFEQLDHIMPLELGGSNSTSNLRLEQLASGKRTATDPLENRITTLAKNGDVSGVSLVDAWRQMAKAKGIKLPEDQNTGKPKAGISSLTGDAVSLGKKVVKFVQGETPTKLFDQLGGNAIVHPVQTFKDVANKASTDAVTTTENLVQSAAQFRSTVIDDTHRTGAEKVAKTLDLIHSIASFTMLPVSEPFSIAEKLPVIKPVAKAVGILFDQTGKVASFALDNLLADSPLPAAWKRTLAEPIHNVGTLAGQIILGGYIYEHVTGLTEAKVKTGESVTPQEIKTIAEDARQKAVELNADPVVTPIPKPKKVAAPKKLTYLEKEAKKATNADEFVNKNLSDMVMAHLFSAEDAKYLIETGQYEEFAKRAVENRVTGVEKATQQLDEVKAGKNILASAENDQYKIVISGNESKVPLSDGTRHQIFVFDKTTGEAAPEMQWVHEYEKGFGIPEAKWKKLSLEEQAKLEAQWKVDTFYSNGRSEPQYISRFKDVREQFGGLKQYLTDVYQKATGETPQSPAEVVPKTPDTKASGVAKSIEAKAVEDKLTKGFGDLAQYDPVTVKDQARRASELINTDIERARSVVRGEDALPDGLRGAALITAMEEHIKANPNADLAYELANSPLVSGTSAAAQELRLTAERSPDSATARLQEVKRAREAKTGAKDIAKSKKFQKDKLKTETEKTNLTEKEGLSWDRFLSEITC